MIEKLIFQIKSLIRARGFLAKITVTDSDDGARGIFVRKTIFYPAVTVNQSAYFHRNSKEGEKGNRIKWNKFFIWNFFKGMEFQI